ncbi:uncharacterized protein N7518_002764 [Penicillium psychrosexuale]|uniref:uncharacterized protein n=1 Tax=Penicillium psychrosexuale TaxID=1002107 RepID=UPI002545B7D4|nr:uncharacterized protein N7518_002764 [Penicillium psychrosexuale]KAJ5800696.1 hypothetical protein N7518_002764 [Penicillium psychrosexuale]
MVFRTTYPPFSFPQATRAKRFYLEAQIPIQVTYMNVQKAPSLTIVFLPEIQRQFTCTLEDVVINTVPFQNLSAQHPAQDGHSNTKNTFPIDLTVLESGIIQVRRKYRIIKFIPLSSDNPIILQQPATDPNLKKALYYQHLYSKYLQEYRKRRDLAEVLGYEIPKYLKNWYNNCLRDIIRRLEQLGYF